MSCGEIENLVSTFYDDELPDDMAARVEQHLAQCPSCDDHLRVLQALSRMSKTLAAPECADHWEALQADLRKSADCDSSSAGRSWFVGRRTLAAIAASLLVICGIAWAIHSSHDHHHAHEIAASFEFFLQEFTKSPAESERALADRHGGQLVDMNQAAALLKYRPALSRGVPRGYSLNSAYVVDMPCCKCLQANVVREDGGRLVAFEHDGDQPDWFTNRPSYLPTTRSAPTRVAEVHGHLAARVWTGKHYLTLIGATDSDEVERLVRFWTADLP